MKTLFFAMIVAAATALPGCTRAPESAQTARSAGDADARVREVHAAERSRGHPVGGSPAAARRGEPLVSRRSGQRRAGTHRVRAPLRAHDVPGLEARARRLALHAARRRRRAATSTARPTSTARTTSRRVPVEPARARAVARVRSHGLPARQGRPGERSRTSRTSCATSAGRASRTSRTASSKRRCSTSCFPKSHPVLRAA